MKYLIKQKCWMFSIVILCIVSFNVHVGQASSYSVGENVWLHRELDNYTIKKAVVESCDYLLRNLLSNGQFVYFNDPMGRQKKAGKYSIVRHLGAVYSLLLGYQITGEQRFIAAAGKSLDFVARFAEKREDYFAIRGLKSKLSIGANGFFIIDLVLYNHLTDKDSHKKLEQGVVDFLKKNLKFDGPLVTSGKWGECQGAIGLSFFYKYVKKDKEIKKVIYEFLNEVKENNHFSHWTTQAYYWFSTISQKKSANFTDYAILSGKKLVADTLTMETAKKPKMVGSKGRFGCCGVTARNEGVVAAYMISIAAGDKESADYFRMHIKNQITHALQYQYGFEGCFYENSAKMSRIGKLFDLNGGVFNSPKKGSVRIDYVSHHIRAMVAYYKIREKL